MTNNGDGTYTAEIPEGVDRGWFMFFVTLLDQFYWFFGATLGGSLVSLKIGEDGLASISEGNLDTEMQEAIKPLEPILLSAFMSEENLAKGAAGSVVALGYPVGIEVSGSMNGDEITVNMKVMVTSKDGQLNVQ